MHRLCHLKLVMNRSNKTIAPLSSACTCTSLGVHENVKLQPTTIGGIMTCIIGLSIQLGCMYLI